MHPIPQIQRMQLFNADASLQDHWQIRCIGHYLISNRADPHPYGIGELTFFPLYCLYVWFFFKWVAIFNSDDTLSGYAIPSTSYPGVLADTPILHHSLDSYHRLLTLPSG